MTQGRADQAGALTGWRAMLVAPPHEVVREVRTRVRSLVEDRGAAAAAAAGAARSRRAHLWLGLGAALLPIQVAALARHAEGATGFTVPLLFALLLVIPGELLRRAAVPDLGRSVVEVAALAVVGSLAVHAVVGGILAAFGLFEPVPLAVGLVAVGAACADRARRVGSLRTDLARTGVAAAAVVALAAWSVLLFHAYPVVGDRVFLGQYDTVLGVARSGSIPEDARAFGATTKFPVHYLFLDLFVGAPLVAGDLLDYPEVVRVAAALRAPQLAFFAVGWGMAAHAVLGFAFPRWRRRALVSAALPALLLFNEVMLNKVREALAEGFGLGLMGIALWAVVSATGTPDARLRRQLFVAGGAAAGVGAGVHLPAMVQTAVFVSAWVAVCTGAAYARARKEGPVDWRALAVENGAPVLAGPAAGLFVFTLLTGGAAGGLFADSVENARSSPGDAFRALLLMSGRPWEQLGSAAFLRARYLTADSVLAAGAYGRVAAGLLPVAVFALVAGSSRRVAAWMACSAATVAAYVLAGPALGLTTAITPWNAIMRNSFYLWVPLSLALLHGAAFAVVTFSARQRAARARAVAAGLSVVVLAACTLPLVADLSGPVRETGWLGTPQATPGGEQALRWVAANTPADAVVLTTEVTFGSEIMAERRVITEGKGTVESPIVTSAAVRVLTQATNFLLPARDPTVLRAYGVDYVVSVANGDYARGRLGGIPLLAGIRNAAPPPPGTPALDRLPYLSVVYDQLGVQVLRVDRDALPEVDVQRGVGPAGPCAADLCITYRPAGGRRCPNGEATADRGVCATARPRGA